MTRYYERIPGQQGSWCAEPERVERAALRRASGVVVSSPPPARHGDLFARLRPAEPGAEQGFLTSEGRFVDRRSAALIAVSAGQIAGRYVFAWGQELFTEDLW